MSIQKEPNKIARMANSKDALIRGHLCNLPNVMAKKVYELYTIFSPARMRVRIKKEEGLLNVCSTRETYTFPYTEHTKTLLMYMFFLSIGYERWMKIKYESRDIKIEKSDIVVDCGAFVGGFSEYARHKAEQVHAIEPSEKNYRCLKENSDDVIAHKIAFDEKSGSSKLNLSNTNVDDSLIDVDSGHTKAAETVRCITIDEWMKKRGVDRIDFLKLEAEGKEVDIIEDAQVSPRKISIDCSPESRGKSNKQKVVKLLYSKGYQVSASKYMVYGKLG